ncbi:response regulator [Geothrix fermentans]|uniref:response regulator n=1 Tax=Geothrix fermentans TaxID=44676 RepID=UPI0003F5435F|nr:response regulator [Geothrix fermentans]
MGQRLLLVDSDRSFLKEHQVSLEAAFDLEVASSPDGVAARLEQGAFAAALISVEVADNKGYALCSTLRRMPALSGLKIALISAKATEEEYRRHQTLKGRADLYLHKPIAPSALVAALTPLVPSRAVDPDNPLGDLVDTELGDDWFEGPKAPGAPAPEPAAPRPPAPPAPPPPPPPAPKAPSKSSRATQPPDTTRAHLLEEQVVALREELRVKDQQLREAEDYLHQQIGATTLNLDQAAATEREVEDLEARVAAAEAALAAREGELADQREKAHLLQLNLATTEAALRDQERDLAGTAARLDRAEADSAAARLRAQEREQQVLLLQEQLQERQEEITRLAVQVSGLRQQFDERAIQHDGERLELMNGLDQKDAELGRLARSLIELREAHALLEREKQAAQGQLSEHHDRLRNLDTLLQQAQELLRRGSDLTRG